MIQSRINQRDDEPVKRLVDNVMKLLRNAAQMSSLIVFFAVNLMISSNCGSLPNGLLLNSRNMFYYCNKLF